jgi:hypothetical protein
MPALRSHPLVQCRRASSNALGRERCLEIHRADSCRAGIYPPAYPTTEQLESIPGNKAAYESHMLRLSKAEFQIIPCRLYVSASLDRSDYTPPWHSMAMLFLDSLGTARNRHIFGNIHVTYEAVNPTIYQQRTVVHYLDVPSGYCWTVG